MEVCIDGILCAQLGSPKKLMPVVAAAVRDVGQPLSTSAVRWCRASWLGGSVAGLLVTGGMSGESAEQPLRNAWCWRAPEEKSHSRV
jgi:hypothetical protein